MTSLAEATREELKQALAVLDDPYKPYKDALKAGKRVRCNGGEWHSLELYLRWELPPEDYEIEPGQPKLYCGHTEEEWQFVSEGKFDVKVSDIGLDDAIKHEYTAPLHRFDTRRVKPFGRRDGLYWQYCHIVRRKNHPQPAFGRQFDHNDQVMVHYKTGGETKLRCATSILWSEVDWFINLSSDG